MYETSYENNNYDIMENISEDIYEDSYIDVVENVYLYDFDEFLSITLGNDEASFIEYFDDWQKTALDKNFFEYSQFRSDSEQLAKKLYKSAISNIAIGTAIIVTPFIVSFLASSETITAIFFAAGKKSINSAISFALIRGAIACTKEVINYCSDDNFSKANLVLENLLNEMSLGFRDGAIVGCIVGGGEVYHNLKIASSGGLSMNEAAELMKESGWPIDVIQKFSNKKQYEICKKAGLEYKSIGGRKVLVRGDINLDLKDEFGRTNLQRMQSGLAPLDLTGKTYELHHIGQDMNSPLAILTFDEHRSRMTNKIWHITENSFQSSINREEFRIERSAFWKEFANMLE